jgi:hypothetical protein
MSNLNLIGKIMNAKQVSNIWLGLKSWMHNISGMNPVERIHPPNQR